MKIEEFQKMYPTKESREEQLKTMSNEDIDKIIESCGTVQGKIYYSKFKKKDK